MTLVTPGPAVHMRPLQSSSIGNEKDHCDVGRSSGHVQQWPGVSRTWCLGPVGGDRAPCLRSDTCTTAPETPPLHAVLRAHPPATSTDCPAVSDGGRGAAISRPFVRGPIGHCDSPVVLPPVAPSLGRVVTFRVRHHLLLCRSIDGVSASAGNGVGSRTAIAPPLVLPLAIQLR